MSTIKEYITDSKEVTSTSPFDLDVKKELGEVADSGWLVSDDGTVLIQLSGIETQKIPLVKGDILNFDKDDKWSIERVNVTTTSVASLTVRYFLRRRMRD